MGTRGAVGTHYSGEDKITYVHFDAFPTGLGEWIVRDIKKWLRDGTLDDVKAKVAALKLVPEGYSPTDEEKEKLEPYVDLSVSEQSASDFYCMTRKLQGELDLILEAGIITDAADFILDSLFCEWAYIVNFDTEELEVYRGFQTEAHDKGRFHDKKLSADNYRAAQYFPCALLATYPFDKIPDDFGEQLESLVKNQEKVTS